MINKKKNISNYFKTKNHYIIQDKSFDTKQSYFLSNGMIWFFGFLAFLVFSFLIYLAISFTSIKTLIPGFPKNATEVYNADKSNLVQLNDMTKQNKNRELWIANLQAILSEKDSLHLRDIVDTIKQDSAIEYKKIIFERSREDSVLRKRVEDQNNLNQSEIVKSLLISSMKFSAPNKGKIYSKKRNGIKEISYRSKRKSPVNSSMKGVVISKTNRNVVIQHQNNFVTVYKNCNNIKVRVGEEILAGKTIGTVADSVFRFQLWYKGSTVSSDVFEGL